jgi:hypothetical protein
MESNFASLKVVRNLMGGVIEGLSVEQLYTLPPGFSNNLIWNLGHVQVTMELLTAGLCGLPLPLDAAFVDRYRKGSQPPREIHEGDVSLIKEWLHGQPARLRKDYEEGKYMGFKPYQTSTGMMLSTIEEAIAFLPVHEGIHLGLMMNVKKFV